MPRFLSLASTSALCLALSSPAVFGQATQAWFRTYDGPPGDQNDSADVVRVDAAGNVVASGFSLGFSGALVTSDIFTIKYDPAGNMLWEARWDGGAQDQGHDMVLDAAGNVYVVGEKDSFTGPKDYVIIKYDANGVEQWSYVYDGTSGSEDIARAVAVDGSGNVYVTGESQGGSYSLATTLKLDSAGNLLWEKHYAGPWLGDDLGTGIIADAAGNVYVSAISVGQTSLTDFTTLKYDTAGNLLWEQRYDDNSAYDRAWDLAFDPAGNVVVAGTSGSAGRFTVIRYSPAGAQLSFGRYAGTPQSWEQYSAMAVDGAGNAVLSGYGSDSALFFTDVVTAKFDPAGNLLWASRYDGPGGADDAGFALALDGNDEIYVAGWTLPSPFTWLYDGIVVKLDRNGQFQWVTTFDGAAADDDGFFAVTVAPGGDVYAAGDTYNAGSRYDLLTVKYTQDPGLVISTTPLQRNRNATVTVSNGLPGDDVYFLYSVQGVGIGPCVPQFGGLCLDIRNPVRLAGNAAADPGGTATLTTLVPLTAPLVDISIQGVARRGFGGADSVKTNTVTETILP